MAHSKLIDAYNAEEDSLVNMTEAMFKAVEAKRELTNANEANIKSFEKAYKEFNDKDTYKMDGKNIAIQESIIKKKLGLRMNDIGDFNSKSIFDLASGKTSVKVPVGMIEQEMLLTMANKMLEIEKQREEIQLKIKKSTQEYTENLKVLAEQAGGNSKRIRELNEEIELRKKITELMDIGLSYQEAHDRATTTATAKREAEKGETRKNARELGAEARAFFGGNLNSEDRKKQVEQFELARRTKELQDTKGFSYREARSIAGKEGAMNTLRDLMSQKQGLTYQTNVTADSMQRMGGGGNSITMGLNYQQIQTNIQTKISAQLEVIGKYFDPSDT